jgi:glycine cleavage system H protein
VTYPAAFHYTKEHEWIDVHGEVGTIGLTDYAQCQLGDIVFIDLPTVGVMLEAGKSFGAVESVKAASDIYAPVSGEVIEVNGALRDAPERVNSDPHVAGWLIKVRLKSPAELNTLMSATDYEASLRASDKEAAR